MREPDFDLPFTPRPRRRRAATKSAPRPPAPTPLATACDLIEGCEQALEALFEQLLCSPGPPPPPPDGVLGALAEARGKIDAALALMTADEEEAPGA